MVKPLMKTIILLLAVVVSGCNDAPSGKTAVIPDVLRVAPLPDHEPTQMRERYQPLMDYLARQTGIKTELVIADSYQHLLELFNAGDIDVANFGGVTFVKARKQVGAEPLIMRDIDRLFSSVVLVRAETEDKALQDLQGKSFAFGSRLSTSGHFMPRYFFNKQNISPETFFSRIDYTGKHDKTAYAVRDKRAYAGVANSGIIDEMYQDGRLKLSEVRVIWESPPYPDYVWAIQARIAPEVKRRIEKAFLNMQAANPEHKLLLDKLGAGYYISANNHDFALLEKIIDDLTAQGLVE